MVVGTFEVGDFLVLEVGKGAESPVFRYNRSTKRRLQVADGLAELLLLMAADLG
jgi:hypothetical protein